MNALTRLYDEFDQSPWLDNLSRRSLSNGDLARWVERGVRGVTSNPSIFQKAIEGAEDYDEQFRGLIREGVSVEEAYWNLVTSDIADALAILAPVHAASDGRDGHVSVEVAPGLANDTGGSLNSARALWGALPNANLLVKIPGTAAGLPAIQAALSEGININITLLFGIERYDEVIEAYQSALEERLAKGLDLHSVASVASFFVSRVDTEVDRRLEDIGTEEALALRGKAAVANAQMAYALFQERFSGPRWDRLAAAGARVQRPLWASTSTKNPAYHDTLYVDTLIGPDTVNTMPDATLDAVDDHAVLARTVDADPGAAAGVLARLDELGIELGEVTAKLEEEGVAAFSKSFDELLAALSTKAQQFSA